MKITLLISTILIIIVAGFYWFQWRPTEIKKDCVQSLKHKVSEGSVTNATNARFAYEFCLHAKGL